MMTRFSATRGETGRRLWSARSCWLRKRRRSLAHDTLQASPSRASGNYLYVAENVADSLAVVDLATAKVVQRFPTDHYPYAVEVAANGKVYVSAWAADTVAEFQTKPDGLLTPIGKLKVGPRPSALLSNRSGSRLFAALAGTDQIAVIDTARKTVLRYLSDAAPAGPAEGSTPNALALSPDESELFVAEADNNAVAVFDVSEKRSGTDSSRLQGRIPTDWYPTAVLDTGGATSCAQWQRPRKSCQS